MAKTQAPLFGFRARGQIGKSLVFSDWRGVAYARQRVIPSNPRTEAQVSVRSVFAWLNDYWRMSPSIAHEPWDAYARGRPLTGRNALISFNVPQLQDATDLLLFVASPGTMSAPPLANLVAVQGADAGEIVATADPGSLAPGWSVVQVVFVALRNQDPHGAFIESVRVLTSDAAPYQATFEGLSSGEGYIITAWGVYRRPDGRLAYGPSVLTIQNAP